jgi:hypothetical protein
VAVYNISYDLISPGQKYEKLINYIKDFEDWCSVLESHWWVYSRTKNAQQISVEIGKILDPNDRWLVMQAHKNHQGSLRPNAWDWLNKYAL